MSNQQPPYNPFMFPFSYPYPPPPFMNPMMPPQPRNPSNLMMRDISSMQKPFPMPQFGYPPFPMMYHPNPHNFFPFYDPKVQAKDIQYSQHARANKESIHAEQSKKIKTAETSVSDKKQGTYIILSDDDSKHQGKQKTPIFQKQSLGCHVNQQKDLSFQPRPRRPSRKCVTHVKQDLPAIKVRVQQKKKELAQQQKKSKIQKVVENQTKVFAEFVVQNQNENISRSCRNKFLTAKDGKGKIMIGDEFQANLPIFLPRNEILTVWIDQRKSELLTRFVK